ncbi:hypothetical protein [Frankia sp. AiPa1]|uniref:hypothetical protein n=1 Tax=Frankia sp. AiPa1 TaxID=573492 RepID=UPI00202B6DB9|nr:hypothetical protein [Frankia sp. AiPa1]MCL9758965.1 hypothetical protein [Frankia sp. AiPa1]
MFGRSDAVGYGEFDAPALGAVLPAPPLRQVLTRRRIVDFGILSSSSCCPGR